MDSNFELSVKFNVDMSDTSKTLKQVEKVVKKAVKNVNKQFDDVSENVEDVADDMADSFDDATDKMQKDAKKTGKKIADEMEDSAEDSEKAFEKMGSGIKKVFGAIAGAVAIDKITDALGNLSDVALETKTNMTKLTTAFKSNNGSAKDAKKTYSDLYKVLGDTDKSLEASQLLSHLTTNQKELSEWTDILTGVYAEFGDSLPVEGLAESANETAKVGEVTGVLADALNWAGVSEEEFNEKLAKCNSEAERERLIRSTLNGLYKESANMYKENNKQAIAYRDAQQKLNDAMATIGEAVLPIKTEFMEIGTSILTHFQEPIINALEIVKTKLGEARTKISELVQTEEFQNLVSAVSDFGSVVKDVVLTAWTELRDRVFEIWGKFGDTSVTGNLTTTAENLTNALNGFNEFLSGDSFFKNLLIDSSLFGASLIGLGKLKTIAFDPLIEGAKTLKNGFDKAREGFGKLKDVIGKAGAIDDLGNAFPDDFDEFGLPKNDKFMTRFKEKYVQGLQGMTIASEGAVGKFDKLKLGFSTMGSTISSTVGTKLAGVGAKIGTAFKGVTSVFNPVTFVIMAVIAIIVLLWKKCEGFRKAMISIWDNVKSSFTEVWNVLKEELMSVWESLKPLIDQIVTFVKDLFDGFGETVKGAGDSLQPLWDVLAWVANFIIDVFCVALKYMIKRLGAIAKFIIETVKVIWNFLEPFLKIAWKIIEGIIKLIAEIIGWLVKVLVQGVKNIITNVKEFYTKCKDYFDKYGGKVKDLYDTCKNWLGNIVDYICKLPSKIKNGISGMVDLIKSTMIDMWNRGVESAVNGANNLIGIVNKFLEKIGVPTIGTISASNYFIKQKANTKRSGQLEAYAKGTNNAHGGLSIVGEAGRELISDPKLGTFLANTPMMLNLSKGASVLRNSKTEKLLGSMGVGMFAGGKKESMWDKLTNTVSNVWDYITNPSKIVDDIWNALSFSGDGFIGQAIGTWIKSLKGKVLTFFTNIFSKDEVVNNPNNLANVKDFNGWKDQIIKAASFFGDTLTQNEIARVLQQIKTESGGRQNAIQSMKVWDINAQTGNLARGLLQYVPSTFNSYKVKGYENINNGYHQLLAFFNNSTWRKALPQLGEIRGWTPRGKRRMANGGIVTKPTNALIGEAGYNEAVVPLTATKVKPFGESVVNSLLDMVGISGGGEQEIIVNVPVYLDSTLIGKSTAKVVKSEIDKMDKRNNRMNGNK